MPPPTSDNFWPLPTFAIVNAVMQYLNTSVHFMNMKLDVFIVNRKSAN